MTQPPDDLTTPLGRAGDAAELKLDPRAGEFSSGTSPQQPTDTYGFDIAAHQLVWRLFPWSTEEERRAALHLVLDDAQFGAVAAQVLDDAKFHQGGSLARITLWGDPAECAIAQTQRRAASLIPGRKRTSTVQCYDIRWRGNSWAMAMDDFPKTFGLWANSAADGIADEPRVTFTRRSLKAPAQLAWSADATLLDILICATRGHNGDFTHLASTKAQVAYSIAADFSF